jgi:hypothetical protein
MNKKLNTWLFIGGATVFNVLLTLALFIILAVVVFRLAGQSLSAEAGLGVMFTIFVAAIVGTYFIYKVVLKLVLKKWDFDKYFDPIIKPRGAIRKPRD